MTSLLTCTPAGTCGADPACQRPSRFQVRLEATGGPQQGHVHHSVEACTSHLMHSVQALTGWARDRDISEGSVTVLALGSLPYGGLRPGPDGASKSGARGFMLCAIPLPHSG